MKTKDTHLVARKLAAIVNSEVRTKTLAQLERWAKAGTSVLFASDAGLFFSYVAGQIAKPRGPWQEFRFTSIDGLFHTIFWLTENESVELFEVEGRTGIGVYGAGTAFLIVEVEGTSDIAVTPSDTQVDQQFARSARRYVKMARN